MLQDSDSPLPWRPWQWAESWHGPLKESWRERMAVYCTPKDVHTSSSRVFHEHSILLSHHHMLHSVRNASMDGHLLTKATYVTKRKDYNFYFWTLKEVHFKKICFKMLNSVLFCEVITLSACGVSLQIGRCEMHYCSGR